MDTLIEKAFMRQDHSILITKLSDLNVPGWLLRLVVTFLSERKMVVLYKGAISDVKFMPGGDLKEPCWHSSFFWYL